MARAKRGSGIFPIKNIGKKIRRPGVHAKTKQSKNKNSKNYCKPYNKQGK